MIKTIKRFSDEIVQEITDDEIFNSEMLKNCYRNLDEYIFFHELLISLHNI